jgi:membrane-associated protease RseP (regulator of RpoE activity)
MSTPAQDHADVRTRGEDVTPDTTRVTTDNAPRASSPVPRTSPTSPTSRTPTSPPVSSPESIAAANRAAIFRLLLVISAIILLAVVAHAVAVLVVIVALIVMVMVHELGHFATAKWSGMKVTEYFLGFGPRLWSIRKGETEYGVKMLPAGGYVRIIGMTSEDEVGPADEPRTYRQSSFPRRMAVAMAGSTMHFVMAFLLLFALFAITGVPKTTGAQVQALYSFQHGRTPAQLAGLKAGDVIVSVDGKRFTDPNNLVTYIEDRPGKQMTIVVHRAGKDQTLVLVPVDGRHETVKGETTTIRPVKGPAVGVIGVELESIGHNQTIGPIPSIGHAVTMIGSLTAQTGSEIASVFSLHGLLSLGHDVASSTSSSSSTGNTANNSRPVSVVGVVQVASQAAQQNVGELLVLLAAVNIFVGMVNMFPMLPLDGGHVLIAVYERIRSRRGRRYFMDARRIMPVAYVMLAFIVMIGLSTLYLDIVNPVHISGG